jgi:hypothetical protein
MATSSKRNDEFFEACSGSEIKVSRFSFGEVLASPNAETFFISSPSIQLSLGRVALQQSPPFVSLDNSSLKPLPASGQFWRSAVDSSYPSAGVVSIQATAEPKEELDPNRRTP